MIKNLLLKMLNLLKKPILVDLVNPILEDYKLLKDLFIEGVKEKHYTSDLVKNSSLFESSLTELLKEDGTSDKYGRWVKTSICTYGKERIGFVTIAVHQEKREIEIWYFSIKEEYQNHKLGYKLLDILFFSMLNQDNFKNYKLTARCNNHSNQMKILLNKYEFYQDGSNKEGFTYYKNDLILK